MAIQRKKKIADSSIDLFSLRLARFTGSWTFILVHIVWFIIWFGFQLDVEELTLILSVEAIFLATILLMAAKNQALRDEARDEADYQTDVLAEKGIQEIKATLKDIQQKLDRRS